MKNISSITFLNPSKLVGGSELLFVRLADYFQKQNIQIHYVDYKDGFARNNLKGTEVIFHDFQIDKKVVIDYDTCVITPAVFLYKLNDYLIFKRNFKVIFWSLHPLNIMNTLPYSKGLKFFSRTSTKKIINLIYPVEVRRIQNLLRFLNSQGALYFMDRPNFEVNRFMFALDESYKKYIPICCEENKAGFANSELIEKNVINIGWVGRLSDDKIHSLLNVVENAIFYANKQKCKMKIHIVGNGKNEHMLDKVEYSENIEIKKLGVIVGRELDEYLKNFDILFAMGTSALEGAKLKVPVVLLDVSYKPVASQYKYRWLHESQEFTLGEMINWSSPTHKHTFEDIINSIAVRKGKEEQGELSYCYYKNNHSVDRVANIILDVVKYNALDIDNSHLELFFKPTIIKKITQYLRKNLVTYRKGRG